MLFDMLCGVGELPKVIGTVPDGAFAATLNLTVNIWRVPDA